MEITINLRKPHTGQRAILDSDARFVVARCGRRFGKTEVGKRRAIKYAITGKHVWWLMPTYSMSTQVWDDLKATLWPMGAYIDVRESERRIKFPNGGQIEVKSTHAKHNLRGAGLDYVILDEAAFMDPEVWTAIVRPMLLERKGGGMFLSTPFGRNWFWELYRLGDVSDGANEWTAFHFPSSANPLIDSGELENVRRTTPERVWLEEYMAEFLEDGAVFRNVQECATAETIANGEAGKQYVIGVDLGKINDYTVFTVIDPQTRYVVHIERFNQIDYTVQLARLRALCDRFPPSAVIIETNIEKMFAEHSARAGLPIVPFTTTNASKQVIIENLALAFERGDIAIPHDYDLIRELRAFSSKRLASGMMQYGAPQGMHDDMVMSLAIAWRGATIGGTRWGFVTT